MRIFKPRRSKRATAISKNITLQNGEILFEVPAAGAGKGNGKIIMGDGTTSYENLPAFLEVPSSLPASDVHDWAKASTKPSYNASEIGTGTFPAKVNANTNAQATLTDFQLRDVKISDQDIQAGTTQLAAGKIYIYAP